MKRMGEIIFYNPNKPEQPAKGVYRWFYVIAGREVTIYVGCAGNRKEYGGTPSTLKRGILEAQRSCLSSDCGRSLDTDFIVGSALLFLKNEGYDCHWQHISDLPEDERRLWLQINRCFSQPIQILVATSGLKSRQGTHRGRNMIEI